MSFSLVAVIEATALPMFYLEHAGHKPSQAVLRSRLLTTTTTVTYKFPGPDLPADSAPPGRLRLPRRPRGVHLQVHRRAAQERRRPDQA